MQMVKVKFSHTCYRVLGLELIPVYRQAARRWLHVISRGRLPVLSTSRFPSQRMSLSFDLYKITAWWQAHRCEQLAQGCYTALSWLELNPWPTDSKSNALLACHCASHAEGTAWGLHGYNRIDQSTFWTSSRRVSHRVQWVNSWPFCV